MYDNGSDKKAAGNGAIPGFLGNEGKCKEVSSVFATILDRRYDQRNEIQGAVPYNWLESLEQLAKERGIWINNPTIIENLALHFSKSHFFEV